MVDKTSNRRVFKSAMFFLLVLGLSSCASAQITKAPAEGPALWRISDSDTTVYIFGAADLLPPDQEWRSASIMSAFEEADEVILEADVSEQAQAQLGPVTREIGLFRDGRVLSDLLTEEQQTEINAVTMSFGVPIDALNSLKPWLASIQIGALNAQRQGYDTWSSGLEYLQDDSILAEKSISYLEDSRVSLLKTLNKLPVSTQVNMLLAAARQVRDTPTQALEVIPYYISGDTEELAERYHGEGQWADELLYRTLLVERNKEWVAQLKNIMNTEKGVFFFAVGVGHMLGPDSLVAMLSSDGVEAVRE